MRNVSDGFSGPNVLSFKLTSAKGMDFVVKSFHVKIKSVMSFGWHQCQLHEKSAMGRNDILKISPLKIQSQTTRRIDLKKASNK